MDMQRDRTGRKLVTGQHERPVGVARIPAEVKGRCVAPRGRRHRGGGAVEIRVVAEIVELRRHRLEPTVALGVAAAKVHIGAAEQAGALGHQRAVHEGAGIVRRRAVEPGDLCPFERAGIFILKQRVRHERVDRIIGLREQAEFGVHRAGVGPILAVRRERPHLGVERGIVVDFQRHAAAYHERGNAVLVGRELAAADGVGEVHRDRVEPAALYQLVLQRRPHRGDEFRPRDRLGCGHRQHDEVVARHATRRGVVLRDAQRVGIVAVGEDHDARGAVAGRLLRQGGGGQVRGGGQQRHKHEWA